MQLYVFHGKREVVCRRGHGESAENAVSVIAPEMPKYIYFYADEASVEHQ